MPERYVKIAWAAWLWSLSDHWDYFCTFTFENYADGDPPGIPKARRAMREFAAFFPALGGTIAACLERGKATRRLHWHALICEPTERLPDWRHGFDLWEKVETEKSGFYLSKYISKDDSDIIIQLPDKLRSMV